MNKSLSPKEVKDLLATTKMPVEAKPQLSRSERLKIWSLAIRHYPWQLSMLHGIEHIHPSNYGNVTVDGPSIFDLGHEIPALHEQGLSSNSVSENVGFFELTPGELHHLSCDCHGVVPNRMVADRMVQLATGEPIWDMPRAFGDGGGMTIVMIGIDRVVD